MQPFIVCQYFFIDIQSTMRLDSGSSSPAISVDRSDSLIPALGATPFAAFAIENNESLRDSDRNGSALAENVDD